MTPAISQSQGQEGATKSGYLNSLKQMPDAIGDIEDTTYDVVVIGAGPAGLMSASAYARFGLKVLIVDNRSEPTIAGRADGVQPRTIEVLKNMAPIGQEMTSRGAKCYERTFWDPPASGIGLERTRRVQSTPTHIDTEDAYTLGVQQGLIERAFLRDMERHGVRVTRPWAFENFDLHEDSGHQYPIEVTLKKSAQEGTAKHDTTTKTVRAKYMVGCDGGRSAVRKVMEEKYGVTMNGDWVDTLWGAIDAVVHTDFPDIRKIAAIHSAEHGAIMVFPREVNDEGKPVVRLYTQINLANDRDTSNGVKLTAQQVTCDDIMKADRKIFAPFKLEFEKVEWWTAYPIGQRIASKYSVDNRVFIAGDACHTHSPKQGQGLNTSMMDAMNLAWKIHLVETGIAKRSLLSTYEQERWPVGKYLIDFDMIFAALFSGQVPKIDTAGVSTMTADERKTHFVEVQRQNAEFTSGLGVSYVDSVLTYRDSRSLGVPKITTCKLVPGMRLISAWASRFVNGEPVRIIQEIQFDAPGGFRIYFLTGDLNLNSEAIKKCSAYLSTPNCFLRRFRGDKLLCPTKVDGLPQVAAISSGNDFNPFFCILTVVKQNRFRFELEDFRDYPAINSYIYADDHESGGEHVSNEYGDHSVGGLHRKWGLPEGGIVLCRPDGYVGVVVPLSLDGLQSLERYFDGFLISRPGCIVQHSRL